MKTTPTWIKTLAILGLLAVVIGFGIAIKIPGNIALFPLACGLFFSLLALTASRIKQVKCLLSYIGSMAAIIGIVYLYTNTKTVEVSVDEVQIEQQEKHSEDIEKSDDLDDALDDLDL